MATVGVSSKSISGFDPRSAVPNCIVWFDASDSNTITGYAFGYNYETSSGNNFPGNIAEVITYSGSLSKSQIQQVEGYLAWKWGLVSSLPSSHPYKKGSP